MVGTLLITLSLGGLSAQAAEASTAFSKDLAQLAALRKARKTDLRAVDQLGSELLARYSTEEQQGKLLFITLAHIHAQSGMAQPDKVREYAAQALQKTVDTKERMILHVYLGDALTVADRQKPFTKRRKEAALAYLDGLKENLEHELPDQAPELPPVSAMDVPPSDPDFDKIRAKHARALKAREIAEFQRDMLQMRQVLAGQITGLYARRPRADEELAGLASETLGNKQWVDWLMSRANEQAKRYDMTPPRRSPIPWLWITCVGAGAGAMVLVIVWKRGKRRPAGYRSPSTGATKTS